MSGFKEPDFLERRNAAANARKAALDKFRAQAGGTASGQRQAERGAEHPPAAHTARDQRTTERKTARAARQSEATVKAAREAAEQPKREATAAERQRAKQAKRKVAHDTERTVARDTRSAPRKERGKKSK
jgi:hypothetical protein